MTDVDEVTVLLALSAQIKANGWFPTRQAFIKRDRRPMLDALIQSKTVRVDSNGQLVPKGKALRRIRDQDSFAREELDRAVQLLKFLQGELEAGRPGPHQMPALQQALAWPEPNDARRATYLLWLERDTGGIQVAFAGPAPVSVTVNEYIWDAKQEELLNDPPQPSEFVVRVASPEEVMEAARALPPLQPARPEVSTAPGITLAPSRRVFVVHGHDVAAKEMVARVLEKLDLEAIILHEQADRGRTIIEKFEDHAKGASFAVALLTPDDVGRARSASKEEPRARQNVVFEAAYFIGRLGRDNVMLLRKPGVEKPSDIDGVVYTELDDAGAWKLALVRELNAAGIAVDANRLTGK